MKSGVKWRNIYKDKRNNRYYEITGIKNTDVEIESSPLRFVKQNKYWVALVFAIIIAIVVYAFRKDLKIALAVAAFITIAFVFFVIFNYYRIACTKDGLEIIYGFQRVVFSYDKIKSIYLSRFNDSSYLFSVRTYNIVIRYKDNFSRLRELFFDASFLNKDQALEFLNNFEMKEVESEEYRKYEKFKLLKKIGKVALIILFVLAIIGWVGYTQIGK